MARKKAVETENLRNREWEEAQETAQVEESAEEATEEVVKAEAWTETEEPVEMGNTAETDSVQEGEALLLEPVDMEGTAEGEKGQENGPEIFASENRDEDVKEEAGPAGTDKPDEIPADESGMPTGEGGTPTVEEALREGTGTEEAAEEFTRALQTAARPGTAGQPGTAEQEAPVLTVEAGDEVETEEAREDTVWHEIHNAYRTRRILSGQLGGVEQTDNGKTVAVVDYKGFRIVIPVKEMLVNQGRFPSGQAYTELMMQYNRLLNHMLGAEIDFIVRGIDSKTRSVVASRREAMIKKRQIFYLDTDSDGMHWIYEGRLVQARVIAAAEKVVRVEIFGVDTPILARDLSWDWIGDARERFSVGDRVLVRILKVHRDENPENISVTADIKSVSGNSIRENLKKCRVQGKYAGKVTDVYKGVVYIRLSNGVNAVAHSCYDSRTPGKKDDVSFVVTRMDEERGVAVGIITRIIRRNL